MVHESLEALLSVAFGGRLESDRQLSSADGHSLFFATAEDRVAPIQALIQ
jgi:hypothetical protein